METQAISNRERVLVVRHAAAQSAGEVADVAAQIVRCHMRAPASTETTPEPTLFASWNTLATPPDPDEIARVTDAERRLKRQIDHALDDVTESRHDATADFQPTMSPQVIEPNARPRCSDSDTSA